MKDIFLIRHGRQGSKLCNVDVSLDESGRKQAKLAGKRLISYQLEKLYCSQLIRAKETAEIIGHCVNLPVEEVADIEEIHFGGFTGKTDEQIRTEYAEFRKERAAHKEDLPYPEGGECGCDVARRVMPKIKQICQREENRVAIVTHGGVIRSVCADILHTGQENKLKFGIDLENTSFTHLIYDEDRDFFILERFNDFAHLESHPELLRKNWKTSLERNG